jgi:hypothetical protein
MRRRIPVVLFVLGLLAGLIPAASATALGVVKETAKARQALSASPNLAHVANLPHANAPGASASAKGSDIEFAFIDVTDVPQAQAAGVSGVREYAVAGTIRIDGVDNSGMQIIDVTDPAAPTRVGLFECTNGQGDIQVFTRDVEGVTRTYATYTTDTSGTTSSFCYRDAKARGLGFRSEDSGTFIVDITNPYAPELVRFVEIKAGSHNQTIHPSGLYMYNSNNELTRPNAAAVEYFDISDLSAPVLLGEIKLGPGLDAHDISFSPDGKRAYVAAITHTLIINTEDPAKPTVIGRIVDPTVGIMHQSEPVTIDDPLLGEKTFVAITDEFAGAAGNGWCPGGGITIYDVTGSLEATPVRVGYWNIPEFRPAGGGQDATGTSLRCTSHVLRFYPEQKLMTIGWYNAGVRVVDISGLAGVSVGVEPNATGNVTPGMKEIGYSWFKDSESWAAKAYKFEEDGSFYLFSNDITRGLDVYRFNAKAPAAEQGGTWLNASQAAARPKLRLTGNQFKPYCAILAS